jgi:hypothetical protein
MVGLFFGPALRPFHAQGPGDIFLRCRLAAFSLAV